MTTDLTTVEQDPTIDVMQCRPVWARSEQKPDPLTCLVHGRESIRVYRARDGREEVRTYCTAGRNDSTELVDVPTVQREQTAPE